MAYCSVIRLFLLIYLPCCLLGQDDDLFFAPDSGIRVDSAGISKVLQATSGLYFIYNNQGPDQSLAISEDGLSFTSVNIHDYPDYRYEVMPDSSYRRYFVEIENDSAKLRSFNSDGGIEFTMDPGYRYVFTPNDAITHPNVYATYFNNALGEVYMVYLAGEIDNARSIHSETGNNGLVFGSYTTDIFGDSILGGGNQSFWDPHALVLPDGSTFTQDPDYRLRFDDYTEFEVLSLNDPKVILLPDGRYRMYMASMIRTGPGENDIKWAIVSATTSATIAVDEGPNSIPNDFRLEQNFPNPFNSQTKIEYGLPEGSHVKITIYDTMGREVKMLFNGVQEPGYKSIIWNGTNNDGRIISAGIYLYSFQVKDFGKTKKMILLN